MRYRPGSYKLPIVLGIVLAVLLVAVVGVVGYLILVPRDPSPSGQFKTDPIRIRADLKPLVTMPEGDGDGGADVAAAVDRFKQARKTYHAAHMADNAELEDALSDLYRTNLAASTQLPFASAADLCAAAGKGKFTFVETYYPPDHLEWRQPEQLTRALEWVGKAAIMEAEIAAAKGQRDQAEQTLKAVLIYGARLADRPARAWFQFEGYAAQKEAARALADLWKDDPAKAKPAADYASAGEAAWRKVNDQLGRMFYRVNKWHPGDEIFFAREHPERAWRVEALLALGMCRHSKLGSQFAKPLLRCADKLADDPDPYVAAAARWARDLSKATYNTQTGDSPY